MFGLVTKKELEAVQGVLIPSINALASSVATLTKELHGVQASLYSFMNAVQYDLTLDEESNPVAVKRTEV